MSEWYANTRLLGHVAIFLILLVPVYAMIIASVVGRPRNLKVSGLFLGFMIFLYIVLIASVFILSGILSLVVA
ncbi:MAG: hypothetical protein ACE5PO_00490 [Candidatus Bathyarchaeia archaeon]